MTAAAAKLVLAQPALGQQIRLLEKELDTALLTRHSRGITPTQAGVLVYERALKILDDVEAAERDVRRLSSDRRDHLVLGVNPTLVLTLGPDLPVEALPGFAASSNSSKPSPATIRRACASAWPLKPPARFSTTTPAGAAPWPRPPGACASSGASRSR